jgi:uncharacterized membrane protein (UPF0127 family)
VARKAFFYLEVFMKRRNARLAVIFFGLAAAITILGSACGSSAASGSKRDSSPTKAQPRLATATLGVGGKTIEVELAKTERELQTGLMFRTQLADGEGMLFVFSADRQPSFWMKNTRLPLSIAYIASNGVIMDIFDMQPFNEISVRSEHYARYALEVPQGYFTRNGIKVGDQVSLPPAALP